MNQIRFANTDFKSLFCTSIKSSKTELSGDSTLLRQEIEKVSNTADENTLC